MSQAVTRDAETCFRHAVPFQNVIVMIFPLSLGVASGIVDPVRVLQYCIASSTAPPFATPSAPLDPDRPFSARHAQQAVAADRLLRSQEKAFLDAQAKRRLKLQLHRNDRVCLGYLVQFGDRNNVIALPRFVLQREIRANESVLPAIDIVGHRADEIRLVDPTRERSEVGHLVLDRAGALLFPTHSLTRKWICFSLNEYGDCNAKPFSRSSTNDRHYFCSRYPCVFTESGFE